MIVIDSGEILAGYLPSNDLCLVRDWAQQHQQELMLDWNLAVELKPLQRIPGADND